MRYQIEGDFFGTLACPIRGLTVFSNNNMYLNGPIFFSDQTLLLLVLGSWLLYFSPLQRSDASGVHCIKSLSGAAQSISPNQAQQRAVVTNFFLCFARTHYRSHAYSGFNYSDLGLVWPPKNAIGNGMLPKINYIVSLPLSRPISNIVPLHLRWWCNY